MDLFIIQPSRDRPLRPTLFDDDGEVIELATAWLRSLVESPRNYSPKTIELYGNNLKYFCEYLRNSELLGQIPIDVILTSISTLGLEKYFKSLQNNDFADSTVRNREASLREFFVWLTTAKAGNVRAESGWSRRYMTRKPRRKMPRFITKKQFIQLAGALNHESQRCVLHFMYETGLRVSEVPRVMKNDIDLLQGFDESFEYLPLLIRGSKGSGKGHVKERYALISRAVFSRVQRYHSTAIYRFSGGNAIKPAFLNTQRRVLTPKAIQKMISDARGRAGFPAGIISPHRLRHGTALSILQGEWGNDYIEKMVLIQTQFGHSSIKSAEQYTHLPAAMFAKLKDKGLKTRFEEAQDIYQKTYLPIKLCLDRRGRPKKRRLPS
ncbi:tyrosine-type recombinase/integrase [Pseudomonas sivasensis]|uniref:tyrosine-type recombinase/integrase n=1 Tax=Pseudomonas sivasensis TaxID=1880678 RepID=UPI000F002046|nr:hypothetical protein ALQ18_02344 [Pseudomonas marginalis pv. marginalis]